MRAVTWQGKRNVSVEEVTGQDLNDVVYLYMNSYKAGSVPSTNQLKKILR